MAQQTVGRARRLTAEQLATWRAFIETSQRLRAVLGARLQANLALAQYVRVLLALNEADANRMRSSALAEHIGWQRSRLSHHLGRMERRGLIRRDECARGQPRGRDRRDRRRVWALSGARRCRTCARSTNCSSRP